ncbi:50S ribosomal 27 [Pyrenophora seminiperda CCB06]|uniref:50S ribosomal 27 n=1 Tax=Pyrenophora seminiperda CCB06 TaxID=1302712 RepID=A0A3M7MIY8_9PLEO|nr:50S ribosomal 27 [Pyrenophora seminiperda CCB06]
MFKATPPLQKMLRRLPLSPKQAGKEYYKGNRVGSMGIINRYGNFIPDWNKIRTFVYPQRDIKLTDLTPFVAESIEKVRYTEADNPENYPKRFGGEEYLRAWKLNGGHDIVEQESAMGGVIKSRRTNMPTPFEEKPATKS